MQLPPEQTARFYRIWLALLHDVNEQLHLVPAFSASEKDAPLPLSDEMQLRNALWANDALREGFITVNPAGLEVSDLAVVASWQYRRAGSFYLVRSLKNTPSFSPKRSPNTPTACSDCPTPLRRWSGFLSPSTSRPCSCRSRTRSSMMGCCNRMRSSSALGSVRA